MFFKILKFFVPFFKLEFGIAPALIGAGISALGSVAGGLMGGSAEESAYKRRLEAYNEMIRRAKGLMDTGEKAFYNNVNNPNTYLNVLNRQILENTNKSLNNGAKQLQTNLALQGIRGGQAGTLLARGIGDMTQTAMNNLNQMNYDDEAQRRNLKASYDMAKAQIGNNAYLSQFGG